MARRGALLVAALAGLAALMLLRDSLMLSELASARLTGVKRGLGAAFSLANWRDVLEGNAPLELSALDVHDEAGQAMDAAEDPAPDDLAGGRQGGEMDGPEEGREPGPQPRPQSAMDKGKAIRVALYRGAGVSRRSWKNVRSVLECRPERFTVTLIEDLTTLTREAFDVVVVPGGIAATIRRWYWKRDVSVKAVVKSFLKAGGGFVGICAGAYLSGFLQINPFETAFMSLGLGYFSGAQWELPGNETALALAPAELRRARLLYAYGPVFRRPKDLSKRKKGTHMRNPRVLLRVGAKAKLHIHATPKGQAHTSSLQYAGLPIVVASDFSLGRIVLSTTHQETDATHSSPAHMDVRGSSACGSAQARVLLNMFFYAARAR